MTSHTKDLSVRIESDDGDVLLDQTITVDCSTDTTEAYSYGEQGYGEGPYGGESETIASGFGAGGFGEGAYGD